MDSEKIVYRIPLEQNMETRDEDIEYVYQTNSVKENNLTTLTTAFARLMSEDFQSLDLTVSFFKELFRLVPKIDIKDFQYYTIISDTNIIVNVQKITKDIYCSYDKFGANEMWIHVTTPEAFLEECVEYHNIDIPRFVIEDDPNELSKYIIEESRCRSFKHETIPMLLRQCEQRNAVKCFKYLVSSGYFMSSEYIENNCFSIKTSMRYLTGDFFDPIYSDFNSFWCILSESHEMLHILEQHKDIDFLNVALTTLKFHKQDIAKWALLRVDVNENKEVLLRICCEYHNKVILKWLLENYGIEESEIPIGKSEQIPTYFDF